MTVEEHRDPLSSEVKPREGSVDLHPPGIQVQMPRLLRAWQVAAFALAMAASIWAAMGFVYAQRAFFGSDVQIVLGYSYEYTRFRSLPAQRITSLEPHSPLRSVGVQVGDLILDPPRGWLLPGEGVRLQIRHDDAFRSVVIRSEHVGQLSMLVDAVLEWCLGTLMLILGLTIALRRRRDVAALAIACALLLGASIMFLPAFPVGRLAVVARIWGNLAFFAFAALAYSALTLEGGYRSRARPYLLRILIGVCAVFGTWLIMIATPYMLGWAWISLSLVIGVAAGITVLALCAAAFADAWRHSEGERRQRLRWLLLAFSVFLLGYGLAIASNNLGVFQNTLRAEVISLIATDIVYAVAMIALTYAVLRHRVIDVGFVISRTLVFAIFTGLLIIGFGLVEWLVDHLVHFKQRETSSLVDGMIAVTLYVVFRPMEGGIEGLVERVFFRASHARETALQQFLDAAPNFSEPNTLAEAFVEAVDAYTGSRGSGIYRRDKAGHFVLVKSTQNPLPRELAGDAEVIIGLRESSKPYYFSRLGLVSPALILPVIRRSELVGFLAVAEKTDRTVFTPDEIESLLRAVHQVNSDLYALQLEHLEQQNKALREELRSFGASSTSLANTS